jgi:hypothetical protein
MATIASLLGAQDVVLRAPSIEAVWTGTDGLLRVQCDRRVVVLGDRTTSHAIPADAVAFDHGPGLAWGTARAFHVERGTDVASYEGPFTLAMDERTPPLRVPFFATDRIVLAPGTSTVRAIDRADGAVIDLGVRPRRTRDRGFGLTGQVIDDLVVPHVFGFVRGGAVQAIVAEADSYVRISGRTRTPLPAVDLQEGATIEGFEHTVPPLFTDLDDDGVPDLVRVDAVRGVVAVQAGLDRETMPAPRVILLKAPILATDAADMTGDGTPELLVLRLPPLTPLQQLAILMESKLSATVFVYGLDGDPKSAPAPIASIEIPIAVKIVVGDQVRRAEIQDLIAFANGKALLASPGKNARVISVKDGTPSELGMVPHGSWGSPLRSGRAGSEVFGVLRAADGARLLRFRIN